MKLKIPPPIQTLIAALLMWGLDHAYPVKLLNETLVWLVIPIFIIVGTVVLSLAILWFYRNKTTVNPLKPETASTLVIEGIYKHSRNPMYLGMAAYLIAWMAWLQNPITGIIFVFYVAYITHFQIKPEEVALSKKFGESFSAYCNQVRRWV